MTAVAAQASEQTQPKSEMQARLLVLHSLRGREGQLIPATHARLQLNQPASQVKGSRLIADACG